MTAADPNPVRFRGRGARDCRRGPVTALLLLGAVGASAPAAAAELLSLEVSHESGTYSLHTVSRFEAPAAAVYAVLTDFDNFHRIAGAFEESRVLEPAADGSPRVYTRLRGCVLLFCRTLERVERLTLEPDRAIVAYAEPEASDVRSGHSQWRLRADGDATVVEFDTTMEPDFWVPPLIGPAVIKRRLARDGERAVQRIERLAAEHGAEGARDRAPANASGNDAPESRGSGG